MYQKRRHPLFLAMLLFFVSYLMCSQFLIMKSFAVAYDDVYEEPDPSTRTDVTINITSPELYEGTIEFYCGFETFYITVKSGETITSATYNVPKGVNKIGFLDPNDVSDSFKITYENQLDTDKQSTVDVKIDYSDKVLEYSEGDEEGDPDPLEVQIVPAEYDFSDGQEHGTITIQCAQYGSIDAVVYKLMGTNRIYDITLDAEYNFAANVYLPAGTYKELTSIDVTPNELATVTSDLTFAWGHRDSTYFGNNYEVTVDNSISIGDLYIKMNYQGDLREVDDLILLQTKIRNDYSELVKERREEFIENELPEIAPTIAETETSAPAIAEATESQNNNIIKYVGIGCGCLLVLFGIVVLVVKHKRLTDDNDFEEGDE